MVTKELSLFYLFHYYRQPLEILLYVLGRYQLKTMAIKHSKVKSLHN